MNYEIAFGVMAVITSIMLFAAAFMHATLPSSERGKLEHPFVQGILGAIFLGIGIGLMA